MRHSTMRSKAGVSKKAKLFFYDSTWYIEKKNFLELETLAVCNLSLDEKQTKLSFILNEHVFVKNNSLN